mmetsp:Transcript_84359/g.263671  ORF Transcript_84359/g.263671 Transcript_84359/m.263671 type:complete len:168 (-) Transcript_84359:95-598(-)
MAPPTLGDDALEVLSPRGGKRPLPLPPVVVNAKADLYHLQSPLQTRDLAAMTRRGLNPHESEFHVQARLGFRRQRPARVRLRPLEGDPLAKLAASAAHRAHQVRLQVPQQPRLSRRSRPGTSLNPEEVSATLDALTTEAVGAAMLDALEPDEGDEDDQSMDEVEELA